MNLKLLTRQLGANSTAKKWFDTYFQNGFWRFDTAYAKRKQEVHESLVKLGETPNPDDVDAVIGNKSWTSISCTSCRESCEEAILIGVVDYDSHSAYICKPCCETAFKMLSGEEK